MPSVIDAVLRLKDEFTPVLNTVQGKLNETKAQGDALSQRIQEHEKVNARAAKQWKQTGNSIKGVGDTIQIFGACHYGNGSRVKSYLGFRDWHG